MVKEFQSPKIGSLLLIPPFQLAVLQQDLQSLATDSQLSPKIGHESGNSSIVMIYRFFSCIKIKIRDCYSYQHLPLNLLSNKVMNSLAILYVHFCHFQSQSNNNQLKFHLEISKINVACKKLNHTLNYHIIALANGQWPPYMCNFSRAGTTKNVITYCIFVRNYYFFHSVL